MPSGGSGRSSVRRPDRYPTAQNRQPAVPMIAFYGIPPAVQTASFQNQNRRDLQWLEEARNGAPLPPGIERITDFSFPTSRPPPSINGHRPFLSNVCKAVGRYSPPASPDAQSEATSGNHHQHNHRFPEPKPETPPYHPHITPSAARKRKSAVLSMYAKLPNCDSPPASPST